MVSVIKGVIAVEEGAIQHYRKLIKLGEFVDDYVTADLVTAVLADKEADRRQFRGFLKEHQRRQTAGAQLRIDLERVK